MLDGSQILDLAIRAERLGAALPVEVLSLLPRHGPRFGDPLLVAVGNAETVSASPRDVLRAVLGTGGDGFVLVHSHVRDVPPGEDDLAVTRRLVSAATVVGVPLLAHLVLGPSRVWDCVTGRTWPARARRTHGCSEHRLAAGDAEDRAGDVPGVRR